MEGRRYRLAVLASHPVQYHVPLYRELAAHPAVDLTVWYCSDLGISGRIDPEFGIPLKWEMPLLDGYTHHFLPNHSPLRTSGRFWSLLNFGIVPMLFMERYDAVMIPGYAYASYLLGFLGGWLSGTPILLRGEMVVRPESPGRLKTWGKKLLLWTLLKGTQAYLAVGSPSRAFYKAHRVPDGKVFFSPYSVDNKFFFQESQQWRNQRVEIKRSLGIPSETPVVLFCGKLIPRKRPHDLLEAFLRLKHSATLLFVGEGSLRPLLQDRVRGRSDVLFVGFQQQAEMARYYALADLFVLPSIHEPWGMVLNEAMACGLPVILSDGILARQDLIQPGRNGLVFPAGDVQALTACLEQLLGDASLRERMGQASLQVIQRWSPETAAAGVVEALQLE